MVNDSVLKTKILNPRRRRIKVLFLDVDGVLTDGTKFYHSDGTISKQFHDHDSAALKLLVQKYKIQLFLISEDRRVNEKWAEIHNLRFYCSGNKLTTLKHILKEIKVNPEEAGFIGDDLRDLDAMTYVGFPISPANACIEVQELCNNNPRGILLRLRGGNGAVREAIQKIIALNEAEVK